MTNSLLFSAHPRTASGPRSADGVRKRKGTTSVSCVLSNKWIKCTLNTNRTCNRKCSLSVDETSVSISVALSQRFLFPLILLRCFFHISELSLQLKAYIGYKAGSLPVRLFQFNPKYCRRLVLICHHQTTWWAIQVHRVSTVSEKL